MPVRIVRILAPNPDVFTLEGTNTWIVGHEPTLVIDPGPDIPEHLDEVRRAAGRVAAVLLTHDHPDHAPGAAGFAASVDAPLFAFRFRGAQHLRDGQSMAAGGVEVTAVHTPGHSSDHVAFFVAGEGALFTGDAVLGRGTSFIDPPDGDLAQYLRSLKRMRDLAPRTIYPGHGPVVLRPRARLDEYLAHREERERQVIDAIAGGAATIAQLVETIYAAYPADVRPLAARSVLAHLLKLEAEGRAQRTGKGEDARYAVSEPRSCARCGNPVKGRSTLCGPCSLAVLQEGSSVAPESGAG